MPNGQVNWQDLGWTGEASGTENLSGLLSQFFADPSAQMKYFEDYDPAGEQAATQQMQLGQEQAQEQARGSLWKQFEQGRQGRAGFGGAGRARQASMAGIHKGLEQGREQAQLGLQEDIRGMHEQYRGDVMGQIGMLTASDVEGASGQQACEAGGGTWNALYGSTTEGTCQNTQNQQTDCEAQGGMLHDGVCWTQETCDAAAEAGVPKAPSCG